jgi:hypothetical protein
MLVCRASRPGVEEHRKIVHEEALGRHLMARIALSC